MLKTAKNRVKSRAINKITIKIIMVERLIDKKIKILETIINLPSIKTTAGGKEHEYKNLDTYRIQIDKKILEPILEEFRTKNLIAIEGAMNIPIFEFEEPTDIPSGDYLFDIAVKDENGLKNLLKKYKTLLPKRQTPLIREKALELIAIEISEIESGANLVNFLQKCGVDEELIIYPNTKWRMIKDVLIYLAFSAKEEDRRTIFKIIEEACHPLMYKGDKILAQKIVDKFNSFLEYDNFWIKNGVLWEGWDDGSGNGLNWNDKYGDSIEDELSYSIFPEIMDELYVYWNELIKLTKFYFSNKEKQDDEINNIYFEIIGNIEKLLNGNRCGGLKEKYKKPFRNMIGCEFEMKKQKLTTEELFINLYDFLGKITEFSLPDNDSIEKIKKDSSLLFEKIKQYKERHLIKKGSSQKSPTTKTEIDDSREKELTKPKNNIPQEIRDDRTPSEILEDICLKLYKAVAKKPNDPYYIIYLKESWEDVSGEKNALIKLKREGIINAYKIYDEFDSENECVNVNAECKLTLAKIANYLKSIRQAKRLLYSKLAKYYLFLINIIEVYFENPTLDEKLNNYYLQLCKKIEEIILKEGLRLELYDQYLEINYCKPFDSLFSAQKEIREKNVPRIEIAEIINNLTAFYGNIQKFVYRYTPKNKEDIVDGLEGYLNELQNKKETETRSRIAPTKIEITGMPEVMVQNASNKTFTKRKERESPIELSLQEPVQWEKVMLKIKEGRKEIEIFYDNSHIVTVDYIRLCFFSGKKQQKPDRQWGFLCALATLVATDIKQATAENMRHMITKNKTLSINNVQQAKKSFTERLKDIFQTHDNPFCDTRDYYEPKFKIQPEPLLRHEEVWPQGGPLNENRGDETDRLAYEKKRLQEEIEE